VAVDFSGEKMTDPLIWTGVVVLYDGVHMMQLFTG
jgi:hypothetical protein